MEKLGLQIFSNKCYVKYRIKAFQNLLFFNEL